MPPTVGQPVRIEVPPFLVVLEGHLSLVRDGMEQLTEDLGLGPQVGADGLQTGAALHASQLHQPIGSRVAAAEPDHAGRQRQGHPFLFAEIRVGDPVLLGLDRVPVLDLPGVEGHHAQGDAEAPQYLFVPLELAVEGLVRLLAIPGHGEPDIVGRDRGRATRGGRSGG